MAQDYVHACIVFAIYMLFLLASQCYNVVRRRNRSNSVVEETVPDEYSVQFGSESSVINSPAVSETQFKKGEVEHMPVNADCAICLGEFEEGEWLKLLPNCTHGFHASCIDTWFRSHSNCPICRSCVSHDTVSLHTLLHTVRREHFSTLESIRSEFPQNLEITLAHDSCPD